MISRNTTLYYSSVIRSVIVVVVSNSGFDVELGIRNVFAQVVP